MIIKTAFSRDTHSNLNLQLPISHWHEAAEPEKNDQQNYGINERSMIRLQKTKKPDLSNDTTKYLFADSQFQCPQSHDLPCFIGAHQTALSKQMLLIEKCLTIRRPSGWGFVGASQNEGNTMRTRNRGIGWMSAASACADWSGWIIYRAFGKACTHIRVSLFCEEAVSGAGWCGKFKYRHIVLRRGQRYPRKAIS